MRNKYHDEREAICKKIIDILELNEGELILYNLENDKEKQEALLGLKTEIQKFFECSTISTFKPNFECKRPYLNLARSILRKQGYNFENYNYVINVGNGLYKKTTKYKIYR